MHDSDRRHLLDQQSELLRALLDSQRPPEGFDAGHLAIAAAALAQKRMRAVIKILPATVKKAAAQSITARFAEYAQKHPLPTGGAREDALCFARHLAERGLAPKRSWLGLRIRLMCQRLLPGNKASR